VFSWWGWVRGTDKLRISEFVKSKYKFKSWETGYSESSGSTYADQNPEIQTTFVVATPTTRQRCNHQTSVRLTESCHLRSKYYRSLGLRERILNLTLMVAAVLTLIWRQVPSVQELSRMLEQQELLWEKAVKVSTSIVTKVSQFSSSCLSMFFMTCHSYKHVGTKGKTTSSGRSQIRTQAFWKHLTVAWFGTLKPEWNSIDNSQITRSCIMDLVANRLRTNRLIRVLNEQDVSIFWVFAFSTSVDSRLADTAYKPWSICTISLDTQTVLVILKLGRPLSLSPSKTR